MRSRLMLLAVVTAAMTAVGGYALAGSASVTHSDFSPGFSGEINPDGRCPATTSDGVITNLTLHVYFTDTPGAEPVDPDPEELCIDTPVPGTALGCRVWVGQEPTAQRLSSRAEEQICIVVAALDSSG